MGSTPFSACAAVATDTRASASIVFFMGALPEKASHYGTVCPPRPSRLER